MTNYISKASALEVAYRLASHKRDQAQHDWDVLRDELARAGEALIEAQHAVNDAIKAWRESQMDADAPTVGRDEST